MTDQPEKSIRMNVTDFINQTTPGHICPFCGNRSWDFIGERALLKPNSKGQFTNPSEIDKAFLTECSGCGFVRMIRPYNLIQRIAQQQAKSSDPEAPLPGETTESTDEEVQDDK
jgi:hypothetical protein